MESKTAMLAFKRFGDMTLAGIGIVLLALPMAVIAALIKITSKGPAIYLSKRIGRNNISFWMFQFRTMHIAPTEEHSDPGKGPDLKVTLVGRLLRKLKIDGLPRLFNIFVGDMSFVGPKPIFYYQDDLIKLRTEKAIHLLQPGLTCMAQIHNWEELSVSEKIDHETHYLIHHSFYLDMIIIFMSIRKMLVHRPSTNKIIADNRTEKK